MTSKVKGKKTKANRTIKIFSIFFVFCILLVTIFLLRYNIRVNAASPGINLGVMGDSFSDEYRADDNRGGSYASTTFNWLELLVKYRGVNAGSWGTRPSPRRTGYEYNWALSGDRAADVLSQGQADGLANQVRSGLITDVVLHVGTNDFSDGNGTYAQVYYQPNEGGLTDAQVNDKVNQFVSDITTAVDKIRAAGNVHILVSNVIDPSLNPSYQQEFPNSAKRQRVTNAIVAINNGLNAMAQSRNNVVIVDMYNLGNVLISNVDTNGNYHVGGVLISFTSGDEPHHMILSDGHAGTVMGGIVDNDMFIQIFNQYGYNLASFSDQELLNNAGIVTIPTITPTVRPTNTPTPTRTPTPVPTFTPTPTPVIPPTTLAYTVFLHGIGASGDSVNPTGGGNTSPKTLTRPLTLTLFDASNNVAAVVPASMQYTSTGGNFQGTVALPTTLPSGVYLVKLVTPTYLSKTLSQILTITQHQTTTIPTTSLVVGDSNNDNQLSLLDYNLLLGCFGSTQSSCSPSDLNDDGIVNGADYNLFLRELSVQIGG